MSKPQNILAKYRTYSYHHILIACDNEAAANFIRRSNNTNVFRNIGLARAVTQDDTTKKVFVDDIEDATGKVNRTQIGAFVVILNGMIDTSFVIRELEWFSATAANTDATDSFTSLAVEGKMVVEEPRGVRFLNALNGACDLLQSDPTGVIWLLKTIFIGHNDDGENSDIIPDLLPLEFMMYDVTGTFSVTGGVYEISFAGVNNGASRYPQFSRVARQMTIPVNDGSLEPAIKHLQRGINKKSKDNRKCVLDALKRAYGRLGQSALDEIENFREVIYRIELDDVYKDSNNYKIDTLTGLENDKDGEGGVIKPGPNASLEQVIRNIMDRCSQVQKDRTEGDDDGIKYIYKIHSEITMVGTESENTTGIERPDGRAFVAVKYFIRRHAELTNQTVERVLAGDAGLQGEPSKVTKQKIEENTITFDYFFTGKNTDIIDFDLKMDMGLAFLQTIASTNNIGTGTFQISGTDIEDLNTQNKTTIVDRAETAGGGGDPAGNKPKILVRSKTPIFPATNVNNVRTKNVRGALDNTLYHAYLSRHAALEAIEAVVTIHGNPYLMSQTNRKPSDTQRRSNNQGPDQDFAHVMANWEYMPGLAKVNIFMPRTNDTPSDRDIFERVRFWYDGYYYIYGIDHKFSDGQFTQNLNLLSLPNEELIQDQGETDITECGVEEGQAAGATGSSAEAEQKEKARIEEAKDRARRNRTRDVDVGGA